MSLDTLYAVLSEAHIAWNRELREAWEDEAGRARLDWRGTATPLLRELHEQFRTAQRTYLNAVHKARSPLSNSESRT